MLGMDFDAHADIFSFGVVCAELLAWKVSDGNEFMKRIIPGFGFSEKEIMQYDNELTPPPYLDIIKKSIEIEPDKRITMKEVQANLKEIEGALKATKNVGTIFIARTNLDSLESVLVREDTVLKHINSDVFVEESPYPSLQRVNRASVISHNIPHRFSIHRSASLVKKCEHCDKHVYYKHLVCDECNCVAHLECGQKLPSYCGLRKSLQNLVSPYKSMHSAESLLSPIGKP